MLEVTITDLCRCLRVSSRRVSEIIGGVPWRQSSRSRRYAVADILPRLSAKHARAAKALIEAAKTHNDAGFVGDDSRLEAAIALEHWLIASCGAGHRIHALRVTYATSLAKSRGGAGMFADIERTRVMILRGFALPWLVTGDIKYLPKPGEWETVARRFALVNSSPNHYADELLYAA